MISICSEAYYGWGNNSQITGGRICDLCNGEYEIGFRLGCVTMKGREYLQNWIKKSKSKSLIEAFNKAIKEIDKIQKGVDW